MNLNVSMIPGVYDNFDLGDTRVGAALDPIPTFMTMRLDSSLFRARGQHAGGGRRRQPTRKPPCPGACSAPRCSRRPGPTSIMSLVPPGAATSELAHDSVGEAYYVLGRRGNDRREGRGGGEASVRTGDAIPGPDRRIDSVHQHRLGAARTVRDGRGQGRGGEDAIAHRARQR